MNSIYDPQVQKEFLDRLEKLTADARPLWGKMSPAQMLTHASRSLMVATGDLAVTPHPLRFMGGLVKRMLLRERPFSKNSPTAKEFLITDQREFPAEKEQFLAAFYKLAAGPHAVRVFQHGFFGKMTADEWGRLMFKHVDHHLRQFGV